MTVDATAATVLRWSRSAYHKRSKTLISGLGAARMRAAGRALPVVQDSRGGPGAVLSPASPDTSLLCLLTLIFHRIWFIRWQ